MPDQNTAYRLQPSGADFLPDGTLLPHGYRLEAHESTEELRHHYDTFEWQAFRKGLAVAAVGRTLNIYSLESGESLSSVRFSAPASFFASSLPDGTLRTRLQSISAIRAYSRLMSLRVARRSWKLLDREEKTIAMLTLERWTPAGSAGAPGCALFVVRPLRGYHDEAMEISGPLVPENAEPSGAAIRKPFIDAMASAGLEPGGYSSKIGLQLNPGAPIHESARNLLAFTTSIMRRNEEGVCGNLDSEFLHDYRVSIRRARSILAQLKGVFPAEVASLHARAVKTVASRTGELRDTDVYLLEEERFRSWLPEALHPGLDRFIATLRSRQRRLQRTLAGYLRSDAYAEFIREWEAFIGDARLPDPELAPTAALPTIEVARTTIRKSWKKVVRHGRQVSRETTDPELHAMRIDCKKLRYLLEFFASLYPEKSVQPAVRHLKGLQENLGGFVDCSVQLEFLRRRLLETERKSSDVPLAATLGGLMTVLHQRQEETRQEFHRAFREFDSDETAELFGKLTTPST